MSRISLLLQGLLSNYLTHYRNITSRNKKLILLIIVAIGIIFLLIIITVMLLHGLKKMVKSAETQTQRAATVGYIIEYKNDQLAKVLEKNTSKAERIKKINDLEKADILAENSILSKLNKKFFDSHKADSNTVKVRGKYKYALNGIALDINEDDANKIKSSPFVKAVYPDLEVNADLNTSVPLIGANQIWTTVTDKNGNAVTGKGVNVAVIDTGIDFTHADFGGTPFPERTLNKITSSVTYTGFSFDRDTSATSSANDKVAIHYNSRPNDISVYSFANGQTINYPVVPASMSGSLIWGINLKENYLVYGLYMSSNEILFVKNLTSGEIKQIVNLTNTNGWTDTTGNQYVYGNFVYYEKLTNAITLTYNIYSYNLTTGVEQTIANNQTYPQSPKFSDNKMIYSVVSGGNFIKDVVYNLDTGEKQDIYPPDGNVVDDFYGSKIIYDAYSGNGFMLYDVSSSESQRLVYAAASGSGRFSSKNFNIQGGGTVSTPVSPAVIGGNGVVYFPMVRNSSTMVAYDGNLDRYVQITIATPSIYAEGNGNRLCVESSSDWNVYCHTYDPFYSYPYPTNTTSKIIGGYNFLTQSNNYLDDHSHGTHVAGIIAASGSGTIKGVAPDANLVAYKVLNSSGTGSNSTIIAAIDAAIATRQDADPNNDISVINLSVGANCGGYYDSNCGPDDLVSQAVDNATAQGITVVIAAGNEGPGSSTIRSPGVARTAITVGSVDKSKNISSFSSRGPVNITGESINKPDVVAPGGNICSSELFGNFFASNKCVDQTHVSFSGTSMAAPHVAGLVALIKQAYPNLTPGEIKTIIKDNADSLGLNINTQGSGFINSVKIFDSLDLTPTPSLTPTPTLLPTPTATPTAVPTPSITPIPTYTINGNVYIDENQNGNQDAGESNYENALISIAEATNSAVLTDANGYYSFSNLNLGSYTVGLNMPNGYFATTSNSVLIILNTNTTVNFGIAEQPTPISTVTTTPSQTPTITPLPTATQNLSIVNTDVQLQDNSSSKSTGCGNQKPTSSSNLYEIDTTSTTATLYFSPVGKPYSDFYINYGVGNNVEQYSSSFSLSDSLGAIKYTINYLNPKTTYAFKVRAGNGCAGGEWSNIITAQTTSGKNTKKNFPSLISKLTTFIDNAVKKMPEFNKIVNNKMPAVQQSAPITSSQTQISPPIKNTMQNTMSINQTLKATLKKKTCFLFICW